MTRFVTDSVTIIVTVLYLSGNCIQFPDRVSNCDKIVTKFVMISVTNPELSRKPDNTIPIVDQV